VAKNLQMIYDRTRWTEKYFVLLKKLGMIKVCNLHSPKWQNKARC